MGESPLDQSASSSVPLVVDVDGTLLATDTLFESFWCGLGNAPIATLGAVFSGLPSRASLKTKLADVVLPDIASLPLRSTVLAQIKAAQADGRMVVLASGADQRIVDALATRLGLEGNHYGTSPSVNFTGDHKAARLVERFGEGGFDYIGDSAADISIWAVARQGYVIEPTGRLRAAIAAKGLTPKSIPADSRPYGLVRAMRPQQWVKNLLLLLPLLSAHRFDVATLGAVLLGIVAFSAAASSIYIINDLLDLSADRQHSQKRFRPFAAGDSSILSGMALSLGLSAGALGLAGFIGWQLVGLIAVYMLLSLAYSLHLKRLRWLDVAMLATLYTLRIVAGSLAAGLDMSGWLANFIFPVFIALGCVKRLTELANAPEGKTLAGRGYKPEDRGDLLNIAIASTFAATVIFVMYSYSTIASVLYVQPWVLRLAAIVIPIWLGRMISRGWRGQMDHDPIVFALRDVRGLGLLTSALVLVLVAAGLI